MDSPDRSCDRRKELEQRFLGSGLGGLDVEEIVELLLGLHAPSESHRKQAREAIERFQNLRGVLEAPVDDLLQIPGIGPHCVFGIRFLHEVAERFLKERIINKPFCQSSQEVFDYLYHSMRGLKKEIFRVIYLNSQNEIISSADLFEGTVSGTPVSLRLILESAVKHSAASVIFVHNHPSGDTTPTKSDKQLTRDLVFIGMVTQIKVLDHLIIGENKYFSFADAGLVKKYEDSFLNIRIRSFQMGTALDKSLNLDAKVR